MEDTGILTKALPKAKKSLGQHFLKSEKALKEIVEASEVSPEDTILEVGPGQGALTDHLVEARPKRLILIEKDDELVPYLKEKYAEYAFVEVYQGDVLVKNEVQITEPYKVVANIPYYISTPIMKHFLLKAENVPVLMTLLVQKEFAEKAMALAPKATPLSNMVRLVSEPKKVCDVPKGAFTPPPKVDSAVLCLRNIVRTKDVSKIVKLIEVCFQKGRKKLSNSIDKNMINMNNTPEKMERIQVLLQKRPEELSTEDWRLLL